ncbi:MAG: arsenate reductase (glutaredoxin) [Pseudomonadota bacterium]
MAIQKDSPFTIYHNSRCSKSRQTLQLLRDSGIEPEIVEYLKTPLSQDDLKTLVKKLGMKAHDILRTKENDYKVAKLNTTSTDEEVIEAIATYPKLLERPIVTLKEKAIIGRPPENVNKFLKQ